MPDIFISLKKHAPGMSVVFFLVASAVAAILLLRAPVFEASARINIPERKISENSKRKNKENTAQQQGVSPETAVEILRGNVLAEQVLTDMGIAELFPELELARNASTRKKMLPHALAAFQQHLTIAPIQGSRVIGISFQHVRAEVSAQVVETILRLFQEKFEELQPAELVLPSEQLPVYRRDMFRAKNILSTFQLRNQMLVSGEEQKKITEQHAKVQNLLSAEQEELQAQLRQLKASEEHFAGLLKPAEQPGGDQQEQEDTPDEFAEERQDIIRLRIYEQDLREKYGKESTGERLINNVHLQIASLEKKLYAEAGISDSEQEAAASAADRLVLAELAYRRQQEKADGLQRQLHQLESRIQNMKEQEEQLAELRQQAESTRKKYTDLMKVLDMEQEARKRSRQVQVLEKPVVPLAPIRPKKTSALFRGLAFGLIGSLLYGGMQLLRQGRAGR